MDECLGTDLDFILIPMGEVALVFFLILDFEQHSEIYQIQELIFHCTMIPWIECSHSEHEDKMTTSTQTHIHHTQKNYYPSKQEFKLHLLFTLSSTLQASC